MVEDLGYQPGSPKASFCVSAQRAPEIMGCQADVQILLWVIQARVATNIRDDRLAVGVVSILGFSAAGREDPHLSRQTLLFRLDVLHCLGPLDCVLALLAHSHQAVLSCFDPSWRVRFDLIALFHASPQK